MLNYIRADLYRMFGKMGMLVWCLIFVGVIPLFVFGACGSYSMEQVMAGAEVSISIIFMIAALVFSEYTFREDKQLGMFKNDTTSGISRSQLFLAKYMTGAFLMILLWLLCSGLTGLVMVKGFSTGNVTDIVQAIFSLRTAGGLLTNLMYLALFQTISIFVEKTSVLLLVCVILSTFLSNIGRLLESVLPKMEWSLSLAGTAGTPLQMAAAILFPLLGIVIILAVGCGLFQKSEF